MPVDVALTAGVNTLAFTRNTTRTLVFKEFFLYHPDLGLVLWELTVTHSLPKHIGAEYFAKYWCDGEQVHQEAEHHTTAHELHTGATATRWASHSACI